LITTHLDELIREPVDVVIELLGGIEPARGLIKKSLQLGRAVITANKALLASEATDLEQLASFHNTTISYSAAVGGVAPVLETIRRVRTLGPIERVSGVLNGTTNFVLDELAKGVSLSDAIKQAQSRGYAEANPQYDLDGTDAAQKLILIAREAFGVDLPFNAIRRAGIEKVAPGGAQPLRLVADCRRSETGLEASVTPIGLELDHPLASVSGVGNRLLIQSGNGKVWNVSGHGAGRWPTAEAVVADLIDLRTESTAASVEAEECVA
jgi:homoserine dehydrogenase